MAKLKPCPDCGHQVSMKAYTCPSCGRVLKPGMIRRTIRATFYLLAIFYAIVAIISVTTQAGSLPTFMPGYAAGSARIHSTHALAAAIFAVVLFIIGWAVVAQPYHRSAHSNSAASKYSPPTSIALERMNSRSFRTGFAPPAWTAYRWQPQEKKAN